MSHESHVPISAIISASTYETGISFSEREIGRGIVQYEAYLPTFRGKTVTQIIEDRITNGSETINILDIGCGRGNFLGELIQRYPQVRGYGISSQDFRDPDSDLKGHINQIDYQVGNASVLASRFPGVDFDLVVSVKCLDYLADPLRVIKKAYRKTKEGGVLLTSTFREFITERDFLKLKEFLAAQGIDADLKRIDLLTLGKNGDLSPYSYALARGESPKLPLPFRYKSIDHKSVVYELTI
jgi:SAM-dependent methyltransferase